MPEREPDVVRLAIPADDDLQPVLEVAVAVLGRRVRLGDDAVQAARVAVSEAFAAVAGPERASLVEMVVEVHLATDRLVVHLRSGEAERTVTIPDG